jgi:twitching motility protein PilT
MILLAGITGSGKSTTIASMLDWINHRYRKHVLTLEDPIEYSFTDDKCLINQREIGMDVKNFAIGMKHAVREDPDVVLVGEMRDRDTFEAAVQAAETGHLVFATLHASSPASAIGRILDLYPDEMQSAVRQNLAFNLAAIICQLLVPSCVKAFKRVPAVEILVVTGIVRKLIREAEDAKIEDVIKGRLDPGMIDFPASFVGLVEKGWITHETAYEYAPNPDAVRMGLKGIAVKQGIIR